MLLFLLEVQRRYFESRRTLKQSEIANELFTILEAPALSNEIGTNFKQYSGKPLENIPIRESIRCLI
jgi:hypothetical protein